MNLEKTIKTIAATLALTIAGCCETRPAKHLTGAQYGTNTQAHQTIHAGQYRLELECGDITLYGSNEQELYTDTLQPEEYLWITPPSSSNGLIIRITGREQPRGYELNISQ